MNTTHKIRRRRGLFSLPSVTRFLGVDRKAAESLIKNDSLPVISIPTPTRISRKVPLPAFHRWLAKRSTDPLSIEELEHELDRIESA